MEELGNILPRVLKKHVRNEGGPVLAVLAGIWPRVAGAALAEQSRPAAFFAGVLTLAVGCPTWAVELKGLRETIRSNVNKALGRPLVRQVRVKLVSADDARGSEAPAQHRDRETLPVKLSGAEFPALAGLDPELREIVSRSFAKYFARSTRKVN